MTKSSAWEVPPEDRDLFEKMSAKERERESKYILAKYSGPIHFTTRQQSEDVFFALLEDRGVTSSWTWEDCMREFINHPIYRAIATGTERKNIFTKFVGIKKEKEEAQRIANVARFREEYKQLVLVTPEVSSVLHYKKFSEINNRHPSFRAIESEREREQLFKQVVEEKFRKIKDQERVARKKGLEEFSQLLVHLSEITFCTRWKDARDIFMNSKQFSSTLEFKELEPMDLLIAFEDHIKNLERKDMAEKQVERERQRRMERKNRDAFNKLLRDLVEDGKLTALTKWKHIFPIIKDSDALLNMIGQNGSQPLDLFHDLIVELEEKFIVDFAKVENEMKQRNFSFTRESTKEQFHEVLCDCFDEKLLNLSFDFLKQKASKKYEEEQRNERKRIERKRSAFKSLIRHLKFITVDSEWPEIREKIAHEESFIDLDDEDMRIEIFEKRVRHIKDKMEREKETQFEEGEVVVESSKKRSSRSRSRSSSRPRSSRKRSRSSSRRRKYSRSRSRSYSNSRRRRDRRRSHSSSSRERRR